LLDQCVLETFYRYRLTENLALNPHIQLILNPARTPNTSSLWVFGQGNQRQPTRMIDN
jgi:carbohydrate-selective porin OprB